MVMAVWLTLNVSADGTGFLERAARARGAPDAPARLLAGSRTNAPVVTMRERRTMSITSRR